MQLLEYLYIYSTLYVCTQFMNLEKLSKTFKELDDVLGIYDQKKYVSYNKVRIILLQIFIEGNVILSCYFVKLHNYRNARDATMGY